MKKLLILLLILPLTLLARPEKKYFEQGQVGQLVGYVNWGVQPASCSWVWNNTGETYVKNGGDDDCDNASRGIFGKNNITDGTCSDGIAGGCDGVYPRIKFSKLKRGTYKVIIEMQSYVQNTNSYGAFAWTDDTSISMTSWCYDSGNNDQSCGVITGIFHYTTDQGETTFELVFSESAVTQGTTGVITGQSAEPEIRINVFYYPFDSETKEIIFK